MIDTKEDRNLEIIDIPNLFIQTPIDRKPGDEKIMMKIEGLLVDMLGHMNPEKCYFNLGHEKVNKVLYIEVLKAVYVVIQSALLSYINMRKYLETGGFKFNPYNPCVTNYIIEGEPLILVFHVYDTKTSNKYRSP